MLETFTDPSHSWELKLMLLSFLSGERPPFFSFSISCAPHINNGCNSNGLVSNAFFLICLGDTAQIVRTMRQELFSKRSLLLIKIHLQSQRNKSCHKFVSVTKTPLSLALD